MGEVETRAIPHEAVEPRRFAISIAAVMGLTIGLVPYLLFVGRPGWSAAYAVIALGIAFFSVRSFDPPATEHPVFSEIVLGGWDALVSGATMSLIALFFFLLGWLVWQAASGIVSVLGGTMIGRPQSWGFWFSLTLAGLMSVAIVQPTVREIAGKLYPSVAGTRSPYLSLILERRTLALLAAIAVVAPVVPFFLFEIGRWPLSVTLALALFYPGLAVSKRGKDAARPRKARVLQAVAKLLEHSGYRTTVSPRTGRPDVDPFFKTVDLLARSASGTLILEVKSRHRTEEPVTWTSASLLRAAASAMEEALAGDESSATVQPLLIVVAREIDPSLEEFARNEGFRYRRIADEAVIDRILNEQDSDVLRALAVEHLGVQPVGPPVEGEDVEVAR